MFEKEDEDANYVESRIRKQTEINVFDKLAR